MTARRPTRLPRWHEWAVYTGFGLLLLTGAGWLALDRWVRVPGDFGPERHPAEQVALVTHGLAAYLFLIVAGALIPVHVKLGWSIGRNKSSGIILAALLALLAATALGLYYFGSDGSRAFASLAHWTIGLAAFPALLIHALRGRRPPARKSRKPARPA